jgi:hypothetical protein
MRKTLPRITLGALLALPLLTGCSETFWTSNYLSVRALPENTSLLTNADVRAVNRVQGYERRSEPVTSGPENNKVLVMQNHVITHADGTTDQFERPVYVVRDHPRQFICAEPSPDVARVVQAAFSGAAATKVDVANPVPAGLAGPKSVDVEASGRIDASRSEAISQLTRRIATIQLLRDGMYRACEAYANGAIGQEIYTAIVSRYDKMMVTMLLAEMASGNLPGLATAGGQAASGASSGDLAALAAKAEEAKAKARNELAAQITKESTAQKTQTEKRAAMDKVNATASSTDEQKATAKADFDKADKDLKTEQELLVLSRRTSQEADASAAAAARAAQLGTGRAVTASHATIAPPANPATEVADVLYRMQRAYLNDSQLGTQLLICASEAAQPDAMGHYQKQFCDKAFAAAFPPPAQETRPGATRSAPALTEAARIQMADIRSQRIIRVLAMLPPTATTTQRTDLAKLLREID